MLIAECTRGQSNFPRLLLECSQDFGMTMPLVHRRVRRQAVEIALAFNVIHPNTFGALDYDVERMIVVRSVMILEFHKILRMERRVVSLHGHDWIFFLLAG